MRRRWLLGLVVGATACAQVSGLDEYAIESPSDGTDAGDAGGDDRDARSESDAPSDILDARPDALVDADTTDGASDAGRDAEAGTVVNRPIVLVQSGSADLLAQNIPTTLASKMTFGNLVVVAITQNGGRNVNVASVTDDALGGSSTYVSANQRAVDIGCANTTDDGNTIEIWYTKSVKPGAKTVTVAMGSSHRVETWVMEFSGAHPTAPLDNGGVANSQATTKTFFAPKVAPTTANALVISTEVTCNTAESIKPPFTSLPFLLGNNTAYYVTSALGSYGAVWSAQQGTYAAATVVFK